MRKLEDVEEQIRNLSGTELAEFRKWYAKFDAQGWDTQIDADVKSGKLDKLAEAARKAHQEARAQSCEASASPDFTTTTRLASH